MSKQHIQAFQAYSKAVPGAFKTHEESWGIYILWQGNTYLVQSAEQLRDNYRHYVTGFEDNGPSYSEIFTETHPELWTYLWEDCEMDLSELLLQLYLEWQKYWSSKEGDIKGGEERTERFMARSYRDLQALMEIVKVDDSMLIRAAYSLTK